jgi:hypothetical protein
MDGGQTHMRTERDEVLLQNYLLGNLSEQAQVQVEDRAFADPGYLAAVEAAEADLIDAYVRGELTPPDRRQFERLFLVSPQRRNKIEFAKALVRVSAEMGPVQPIAPPRRSIFEFFRTWNPAFQVGAAMAALILFAGVIWLIKENSGLRGQLTALQAQQQRPAPKPNPPSPTPPEIQHPEPVVPALLFLPGLTRAESRLQEMTIPPTAQLAHMELQLEPRDDYPQYRVELHTRSGQDILTLANLRKRGKSVSFDLPAGILPPGDYELALKGLSNGEPTDLAYHYFRVRR